MAKEHERKLPAAGGAGSGGGDSAAGGGRDIGLELSERIGASRSASSQIPYSPGSIEYGAASAAEVAGRIALESARTYEGYRVVAAAGGGGIVSTSDAGIEELSLEVKMLKDALASKDVEAEYEAILALAAKKEKDGVFYEAAGLLNYALNLSRAATLEDAQRDKEKIPADKCKLRDAEIKRKDLVSRILVLENKLCSSMGIEEIREEQKYEILSTLYKKQLYEIREWADLQLGLINRDFVVLYKETGELSAEERELEFLKAIEIEGLFKEISLRMRNLTKQMLQDSIELLEEPPCEYAVICFGSMARNEMTPYSDFEWGIIVEREDQEVNDYFSKLTKLMQFRMINLGETILPSLHIKELRKINFFDDATPRGFSMDGLMGSASKWPLGNYHIEGLTADRKFRLLGTAATLAELHSERWWHHDRHLTTVLESVQLVHFSEAGERLLNEFRKASKEQLALVVGEKGETLRIRRGLNLLTEAVHEHLKSGGKQSKEGHHYDVKRNLYRAPNILIDSLCICLGIDGTGLWEKLGKLKNMGLVGEDGYRNLYAISSIVLGWRLEAYLDRECQRDEVILMEESEESIGKLERVLKISREEFFRVHYTLRPLMNQLDRFITTRGEWQLKNKFYNNTDLEKGLICKLRNECNQAMVYYKKVLDIKGEGLERDYVAEATTLVRIGNIYYNMGDYEAAMQYYEAGLKIESESLGENHPEVAATLGNMAVVYERQAEYEKALKCYEKALIIKRSRAKVDYVSVAATLGNMALVYDSQGKYAEALKFSTAALEIQRTELGRYNIDVAITLGNIANVNLRQGEYDKALKYYAEALEIERMILGDDHPNVGKTLGNMAGVYFSRGEYGKALQYFTDALEIKRRRLGVDHPSTASTMGNIAAVFLRLEEFEKALQHFTDALEMLRKKLREDNPDIATTLGNIAVVYKRMGQYDKSLTKYAEALEIQISRLGKDHPDAAVTFGNMSALEVSRKNFAHGLKFGYQAVKIINKYEKHQWKEHIIAIYISSLKDWFMELGSDDSDKIALRLGQLLLNMETFDVEDYNEYLQIMSFTSDISEKLGLLTLAEHFVEHSEKSVPKYEMTIIYNRLACYYHVNAIHKRREGDVEKYLEYLAKAEERFNKGLRLLEGGENMGIRVEYSNFLIRNDRIDEAREQLEQVVRNRDFEGGLSYGVDELEVVDEIIKEEILKTGMVELNAQIFGKYLLIKILHNKGELEERDRLIANLKESVDRTSHTNIHKKLCGEVLRLAGRIEEADRYTDGVVERAIDLSAALAAASLVSADGGGALGEARASTIISSGGRIPDSRRDLDEREEESVAIFISLGDRAERIINTLIRSWRARYAEGSRAREEDGGSTSRG